MTTTHIGPRPSDPGSECDALRVEFLATVPAGARKAIELAFAGKASPRAVIKAKCLDCSGFDRAEIANCSVVLCELHSYRPFQKTARKAPKNARADGISRGTTPLGSAGSRPSARLA